jgi:hypothetical protein
MSHSQKHEVQPTSNQDLGGGGGRQGRKEGGGIKTTTTNNVQPNRKVTRIEQQLRFDHVTTKDVQRKKSWWVRTTRASEKLNKNRRKKRSRRGKVVLKIKQIGKCGKRKEKDGSNERASQGIIPGGSACSGGLRAYHRHIWKAVAYHRPTATAYFSP